MIRIAIADDHELIREGIKKIIRSARDMQVVGEAADLEQALRQVRQSAPDLLVLDISLPGYDGLNGLAQTHRRFPTLPILVLSMYPEERFAVRAMKTGASGYITKAMAAEELIKAIRQIVLGGVYVSPRLAELLVSDARQPLCVSPHDCLTERELQVVAMLGAGKQVKQIAAELTISISTVNTYRSRIFKKMGLCSNAALIRYALEHRLVD